MEGKTEPHIILNAQYIVPATVKTDENDELSGNKTARKDDVPNPDTRPEITFGLS